MKILVAGSGGFIGGHLAKRLCEEGNFVRSIDIKRHRDWCQRREPDPRTWGQQLDLSDKGACEQAVRGMDAVYNLASDMGGMGFIETHKADCMLSVLINTNLLNACHRFGVKRYFFSSSACVYRADLQTDRWGAPLKESDAYPAMPEDGYGWEKLFSERMCRHFLEDYGIETRVGRYHNVYGPMGTYYGGREKAPAAICRKVIEARDTGEIEIWGDGNQTRSFMFIDDCVRGTLALMESDHHEPLNIGSSELVSINQLVDIVEEIAGYQVKRQYNLAAPRGVNGRNSDNTLFRSIFGWEPSIPLREGMEKTFRWIYDQMKKA